MKEKKAKKQEPKKVRLGRPPLTEHIHRQSFTVTTDLMAILQNDAEARFEGNVSKLLRYILTQYYKKKNKV